MLLVWVAIAWPLVTGERTLVLRDVFSTHLPYKWFGAAELASGSIPAINPTWSLGQPFRGNPNTLPFYPGNLFYLVLPFWSAFSLHYMLHWLLAFLGMRALARALGRSAEASLLAALAWAGSGLFLSLLTFYNLLTVAAWAPFVLWGLVRGGRRGTAGAGVACGLMLLGGEPVAAALVVPAMVVAASHGRSWRAALARTAAAGALGLLVALPQIVATARVLPFTYRGAHGLAAGQAAAQALHPLRLLELVLPLPWGWPGGGGRFGYWANAVTPSVPYVYSLHIGIVAAVLAAIAIFAVVRRAASPSATASIERRFALLAVVSLLLAWAGGLSGDWTLAATGGLFRYPQKLVLLFALAAAPLAAFGFDRAIADRRAPRALAWTAAICLATALCGLLLRAELAEWLRRSFEARSPELAATAAASWIVGFALAGAALAAAAFAFRRGWPALAVAVQLVALFQLAPALVTDEVARYRDLSPFGRRITEPRRVLPLPFFAPDWERRPPHRLTGDTFLATVRVGWLDVEPPFGVPHGIRYPLAPDLEGMTSPLSVFLLENLAIADWPMRMRWLRRLGVGWVVRYGQEPVEGLERVEVAEHEGARVGLDRVAATLPSVRWPERVVAARSPIDAFLAIARGGLGAGEAADRIAVASRPVEHRAGGRVELVAERPDRIEVEVEGEGGLLVVARAWQPIYRARLADGTRLATQPVDVVLLGIEVPSGRQRVTIDVSSAPEKIAGLVAALVVAALAVVAWRGR